MAKKKNTNPKRYYWLKLQENYFQRKEVKKLRRIAGGDTLVVIYLEMLLLAMKTDGLIAYSGIEDSLAAEVALDINEDEQSVEMVMRYLVHCNMGEFVEQGLFLPEAVENTGSEGDSAERVRKYREAARLNSSNREVSALLQCNGQALQCNNDVTQRREELELEEIREDKIKRERVEERGKGGALDAPKPMPQYPSVEGSPAYYDTPDYQNYTEQTRARLRAELEGK